MTIEQAKVILKNPELGKYLTREEMEAIDFLISSAEAKEQKSLASGPLLIGQ